MKKKTIFALIMIFSIIVLDTNAFSQGYYKDIFMDGGVSLASRQSLPAQMYLNLSMEFIATEDTTNQNSILVANPVDENGVLLYPDGEPRFRVIYTNGGRSSTGPGAISHGESLGAVGRDRVRQFFNNGGSFTGSCAGAYITSMNSSAYYQIWPGLCRPTTLNTVSYVSHFIPSNSPLLNYYNFGNDLYIADILHGGGPYANENSRYPPETEALLRYDYPAIPEMHNKISCWAYKKYDYTGRIAVIGSHPEGVVVGEGLELMAAILQYAIEGSGSAQLKDTLANGELRVMNKNTFDNNPAFSKIGDKQYHHFMVKILKRCNNLKIFLDGDNEQPFNLYVKKDSFAFRNTADYADTSAGSDKIIHVPDLTPGNWYIGVECDTTITSTYNGWGYTYSGNVSVLNGAAYSIRAEWYDPNAYPQNTRLSAKCVKAFTDSLLIHTHLYNPHHQNVKLSCYINSFDGVYSDSFPMYDDGLHQDSLSGDGLYGAYTGPFNSESHFDFGLKVTDLQYSYHNYFPGATKFTTIGPVVIENYSLTNPIPGGYTLDLTLRNNGLVAPARNITTSVSTSDTSVQWIQGNLHLFGNIPPGQSKQGSYSFLISEKSPSIDVTIDILSDGYIFWTDTLALMLTGIKETGNRIPHQYVLKQNYPNPFNPITTIEFALPHSGFVTLKIYDILGEEVVTLVSNRMTAGKYEYNWDAGGLASGVYFYRLDADKFSEIKKCLLLK